MGKLVLFLADGTALDILLRKERVTIGRRADNDVCLPHPAVSAEHAVVVTILSDSFLEDLDSTNGTIVNGIRTVKHFLRDYDQVNIGRQRLVYMSDEKAEVEPPVSEIARNRMHRLSETAERAAPAASVPASDAPPLANAMPISDAPPLASAMPVSDAPPLASAMPASDAPPLASAMPVSDTPPLASAMPVSEAPPLASGPAEPLAPALPEPGSAPATNAPPAPQPLLNGLGAPIEAPAVMAEPMAHGIVDPCLTRSPSRNSNRRRTDTADARTAPPQSLGQPAVRVLSGPQTGRTVPFANDQLSVGRSGVQVAVIRKNADGFHLVPLEGREPPRVNGETIAAEGIALLPGDTFEVAGVRLEIAAAQAWVPR